MVDNFTVAALVTAAVSLGVGSSLWYAKRLYHGRAKPLFKSGFVECERSSRVCSPERTRNVRQ